MSRRPHHRVPHAFTLIELLVVIAVIAVLMGLLLPALFGAREAGRQVACMSNVRQLAMACGMYQDDHEDTMLTHPDPGFVSTVRWGGKSGASDAYSEEQGWGAADRVINPYAGVDLADSNHEVETPAFLCPADRGQPGVADRVYDHVGTSYMYNRVSPSGRLTLHPDNEHLGSPLRVYAVRFPDTVIQVADHPAFNFFRDGDRTQRWHALDGPTANISFVDGHVDYLRIKDTADGDTDQFVWMP